MRRLVVQPKADQRYEKWRGAFMRIRLRLGALFGALILITFMTLNLSRYPEIEQTWLNTNLIQSVALLLCAILLFSPSIRREQDAAFVLLSWSFTLIPIYWFHVGEHILKVDFVTWTLVFLAQATLMPVKWHLHALSQLGVFALLLVISLVSDHPLNSSILGNDFPFLFTWLLWFCVICDIAVYLHERLLYNNFITLKNLQTERAQSEHLLLNIFPEPISRLLKKEKQQVAEYYPEASILFADLVGFTNMCDKCPPGQVVTLLNDLFTEFDELALDMGLEKIKTIGDAYMAASGVPTVCDDHLERVADFALALRNRLDEYNKDHSEQLLLRIGIHSGPVVAGVIGSWKFSYDLWGDTVNTASRMESQGVVGQIQVTDTVYQQLQEKFLFENRGEIQIKGKGMLNVYLLKSRR
ncbi:MAG: adenylate/guanylate cyclase domain-containing protein [Candidatus Sedimenticola sp. (ex Thyasira tokunagai)]